MNKIDWKKPIQYRSVGGNIFDAKFIGKDDNRYICRVGNNYHAYSEDGFSVGRTFKLIENVPPPKITVKKKWVLFSDGSNGLYSVDHHPHQRFIATKIVEITEGEGLD